MQLAADGADALDKPGLDVHVDILEADHELDLARLDVGADRLQPLDDGVGLGLFDNALARQHAGVNDRALDVVAVEALVEVDAGGEFFHEFVGGGRESAGPGFLTHVLDAP